MFPTVNNDKQKNTAKLLMTLSHSKRLSFALIKIMQLMENSNTPRPEDLALLSSFFSILWCICQLLIEQRYFGSLFLPSIPDFFLCGDYIFCVMQFPLSTCVWMTEPQVIIVITLYDDTFHSGIKTRPLALLSASADPWNTGPLP